MSLDFHLRVLPVGAVQVSPRGDLDLATAGALTDLLETGSRLSPSVVVDLADVTFMDSTAIAVLMRARERVNARGGVFVLVGTPPTGQRILAILGGSSDPLPTCQSLDDAIVLCQQRAGLGDRRRIAGRFRRTSARVGPRPLAGPELTELR